jgi:hypothetical protein
VFENATDKAAWLEIYTHLCRMIHRSVPRCRMTVPRMQRESLLQVDNSSESTFSTDVKRTLSAVGLPKMPLQQLLFPRLMRTRMVKM